MSVRFVFWAAMFALAFGSSAQAQRIVEPDWLSRPDGEQVGLAYPELAKTLRIAGRATISCSVNSEGRLRNCVTMDVSPAGLGFDAAALELTELFRMTPLIVDGRPRGGGNVRIPIRFILPEAEESEVASSKPPVPDPAEATLVSQLAPLISREIAAQRMALLGISLEEAKTEVDPATWAVAATAMQEATDAIAPEWGQALAQAHAAVTDGAQLKALLDFKASPSGLRYEPRQTLINVDIQQLIDRSPAEIQAVARKALCLQVRCDFEPWQRPEGVKLVNPRWARQPDEAMLRAGAPPFAQIFGLPGWAQINCVVAADGGLDSCIAARQTPSGLGFGRAAQVLSLAYEISPEELQDGAAGETVAVLIRFPADTIQATPEKARLTPKNFAPNAASIELARKVVAASGMGEEISKLLAELSDQGRGNIAPLERTAILTLHGATKDRFDRTTERAVELYASAYSQDELRSILAWKTGPGGTPLFDLSLTSMTAIYETYEAKLIAEARKRFCAQRPCEIVVPKP